MLRDLVAVLPAEHPQLRNVPIALGATGVVRGEFGYRDALLDQRTAMEAWLSDERPAVQAFAKDVLHSLENEIAAAERRAREEIAMSRLEFAEPLDDPPNNPDEDKES